MLTFQDLKLGGARAQFQLAADDVSFEEDRRFARLLPQAVSEARAAADHWDFMAPARAIDRLLEDESAFPRARDVMEKHRLRRAAVARLALDHFQVEDRLPSPVMFVYPDFFKRLAKFLADGINKSYDDEFFAKDVRYALGLTIPAGALQFDLKCRMGPRLILREIARTASPGIALAYFRSRGWGRWYNEHIDLRAMRDFNPEGWTAHCATMAQVLEMNPTVLGILGAGWFYDPAVAEVSPGLAYIRETQMRHGAFLLRVGTEPHHIRNAIYRSAIRKRLYEEGKYLPTCYMLAWPRRSLIAWAQRLKSDPSVGFGSSEPVETRQAVISVRRDVASVPSIGDAPARSA